jgi:hypothetical protein
MMANFELWRYKMGVTDRLWVKLTCEKCGISETSTAAEKGSMWGASWNDLNTLEKFEAVITGGGREEPDVKSAKCNTCGANATIDDQYGFQRPPNF